MITIDNKHKEGIMTSHVSDRQLIKFFENKEVIEYQDGELFVWYDNFSGYWREINSGSESNPKTCKYSDNDITYHGYGLPLDYFN